MESQERYWNPHHHPEKLSSLIKAYRDWILSQGVFEKRVVKGLLISEPSFLTETPTKPFKIRLVEKFYQLI